MFLHLGQDFCLNQKDIIGIFDMENTTTSKITRNFLAQSEKHREIVLTTDDLPKSYVLCASKEGALIYVSQISTATLKKRLENIDVF